MPTRRCCCSTCLIAEDVFDRTGTTLGAGWTEKSGSDWSTDGDLAVIDLGPSYAKFNTVHPTPSTSMVVTYEIVDEILDAKHYILLNWKDWNNYHIATYTASAIGDIELGKVVAGVYTAYTNLAITGKVGPSTIPPQKGRKFRALIADNEFCASISEAVFSQVTCVPGLIADGYYCGMGGDTTASWFEYFRFYHHLQTKNFCEYCICKCDQHSIPDTLYATFTGTGQMSAITGCVITLTWSRVNGYWSGSSTCCGTFSVPFSVRLNCTDDGTPEGFLFEIVTAASGCMAYEVANPQPGLLGGQRNPDPVTSTCDPLYLHISIPYFVPSSDLACACRTPFTGDGEFTVEITE